MDILRIFEIAAIVIVSCLMVIFAGLYFSFTRRQKKLSAGTHAENNIHDVASEWAEQLQIMHAQLDLIYGLSTVFVVCYDYTHERFSISANGREQLGLAESSGQQDFEDLIHPDALFIYEEMTEVGNIRKARLADNPYILKIKCEDSQDYAEYLARIKPVYDDNGFSTALIIAFVNTDYLKRA